MPGLGVAGRIASEGAHLGERATRTAVRAAAAPRPSGGPRTSSLERARAYNAARDRSRVDWRAGLPSRQEEPSTPGSRGEVAVPQSAAVIEPPVSAVNPPSPQRSADPAPAPDGVELWYFLRRYLSTYVSFRTAAEVSLVAAWIIHAVARERDDTGIGPLIWRASPRLLITSRKRGSGKSTLLDLIVILTQSARGKIPRITPAKFAKVVGKHFETVALDEAKTIFGSGAKSLELQGIILAGYTRRTSYEVAGDSYPLFSAVAYAGKDELITSTRGEQIGDLVDRSFTVRLFPPAVAPPEVDEDAEEDGELLAQAIIAWTNAHRAELVAAARDLSREDRKAAPKGTSLRALQIGRPLRAIGRILGPAAEADVCAAIAEMTEGAASAEHGDIMTRLRERSAEWDEDFSASETGRLIVTPGGDDEDYSEEG